MNIASVGGIDHAAEEPVRFGCPLGILRTAEGGKSGVMAGDLQDEYVQTRDGQYGRVSKIDKRDYCEIVDEDGNVIEGKGHEPAHTLTVSFKAAVDLIAKKVRRKSE